MLRTFTSNFWIDSHIAKYGNWKQYPAIERDPPHKFDVAVIGGGWFGLNTALKLHEMGKKVIVLESQEVGSSSVASWSTAKVSSLHQVRYSKIASKHSSQLVEMYGQMNEESIADLEKIIQKYKIQCQWTRAAHIVFAQTNEEFKALEEEEKAVQKAGFKINLERSNFDDLPQSMKVLGALRATDQAHMNPVSYLIGIADVLNNDGVSIHGNSRVVDVSFTSPHKISLATGCSVLADKIVVATHLPILNRTGHFAMVKPSRSYCIAVTLKDSQKNVKETYINADDTHTISFRPADDGKVLIVSGAGHPVGEYPSDNTWGYETLIQWTKRHFDIQEVISRWSAMDYYTADEIPYMGQAMYGMDSIYTATGFAKWGFTQGIGATNLVADLITGRENKYNKFFDARRWDLTHSAMNELKNQAEVAKHFIADRFNLKTMDIEDLMTENGGIFKDKGSGEKVAVFKDKQGVIHKFSPVCTHLGCFVQWNEMDKIFECPCHGSVFTSKGDVIHGPATKPLKKM